MARSKKKATVASAPPSTPPASKKRKTSSVTATGDVKVSSSSASSNNTKAATRGTGRKGQINGKKAMKDLNEWDQKRCEEFFDVYANTSIDPDIIDPSGYQNLCEDLGVDLTGALPLIISWKLGATNLFHVKRNEWIYGMKALNVDTIDKMKAILPLLEQYKSCTDETFSELYHWTFLHLREGGLRKVIDLETAVPILEVLFQEQDNQHIGPFLEFLKQNPPPIRSLNKDQWDSFYVFSRSVDNEFSGYTEEAAWPILIDEYVEWRRRKPS